ncbi:MAG: diacylglycerol kinase family lipid kinase [Ruminococcaceae bacterium]|nr:diacylglycerol kinase family lipid kinase [Oscillospiraceae bacterium]
MYKFFRGVKVKHILIINPNAGKGSAEDFLRTKLVEDGFEAEYEIYVTKAPRDATKYVKERCLAEPEETLRFYACGGDGTLNEVSAGAVGFKNAEVACYPCGSGNDYIKYYGTQNDFSLARLKNGVAEAIDMISVNGRYAINACHFGFDSFVAQKMAKLRRRAVIGGKNAYNTAVAMGLFGAMNNDYTVEVDGEILNPQGRMLLCTVANGGYVGGGYHCAPRSDNSDGLLEVCFVKPISIPRFLSLMTAYRNGEHLDDPRFEKYIEYRRAKTVRVTSHRPMPVSLDGEVEVYSDFTVTVESRPVNFVVPEGLTSPKLKKLCYNEIK